MKVDREILIEYFPDPPSSHKKFIELVKQSSTNEELIWLLNSVTDWSSSLGEDADLCCWVDVLDVIDGVFEKTLTKDGGVVLVPSIGRTSDNTKEDKTEKATDSSEQKSPLGSDSVSLLKACARFTKMLLSHCRSKSVYRSLSHLQSMLSADDLEIEYYAVEAIAALVMPAMPHKHPEDTASQETDAHETWSISKLLLCMAQGWGSRAQSLDLKSVLLNSDEELSATGAGNLHFEFYTGEDSVIDQDAGFTTISLSAQQVQQMSQEKGAFEKLVETHKVPEKHRFPLLQRLRLAQAFGSKETRERRVNLRLLALTALLQANRRTPLMQAYFQNEPELTQELVSLVCDIPEEVSVPDVGLAGTQSSGIPFTIAMNALNTLEAIPGDPTHPETSHGGLGAVGKQSGVLQALGAVRGQSHGVLPSLIRTVVQVLVHPGLSSSVTNESNQNKEDDDMSCATEDMEIAFGVSFAQAAADGSKSQTVAPTETTLSKLFQWMDAVLNLTGSIVATNQGASALTDSGFVHSSISLLSSEISLRQQNSGSDCKLSGMRTRTISLALYVLCSLVITDAPAARWVNELDGVDKLLSLLEELLLQAQLWSGVCESRTKEETKTKSRRSKTKKARARVREQEEAAEEESSGATSSKLLDCTVTSFLLSEKILLQSILQCLIALLQSSSGGGRADRVSLRLRSESTVLMRCLKLLFRSSSALQGAGYGSVSQLLLEVLNADPNSASAVFGSGLCSDVVDSIVLKTMPKDPHALSLVPQLLSSLCLSKESMSLVAESEAPNVFISMLCDEKFMFSEEVVAAVGTGLDALVRHDAALRAPLVRATIKQLERIRDDRGEKGDSNLHLRLLTQFLQCTRPMLDQSATASEFSAQNGADILLLLYSRSTIPTTDIVLTSGTDVASRAASALAGMVFALMSDSKFLGVLLNHLKFSIASHEVMFSGVEVELNSLSETEDADTEELKKTKKSLSNRMRWLCVTEWFANVLCGYIQKGLPNEPRSRRNVSETELTSKGVEAMLSTLSVIDGQWRKAIVDLKSSEKKMKIKYNTGVVNKVNRFNNTIRKLYFVLCASVAPRRSRRTNDNSWNLKYAIKVVDTLVLRYIMRMVKAESIDVQDRTYIGKFISGVLYVQLSKRDVNTLLLWLMQRDGVLSCVLKCVLSVVSKDCTKESVQCVRQIMPLLKVCVSSMSIEQSHLSKTLKGVKSDMLSRVLVEDDVEFNSSKLSILCKTEVAQVLWPKWSSGMFMCSGESKSMLIELCPVLLDILSTQLNVKTLVPESVDGAVNDGFVVDDSIVLSLEPMGFSRAQILNCQKTLMSNDKEEVLEWLLSNPDAPVPEKEEQDKDTAQQKTQQEQKLKQRRAIFDKYKGSSLEVCLGLIRSCEAYDTDWCISLSEIMKASCTDQHNAILVRLMDLVSADLSVYSCFALYIVLAVWIDFVDGKVKPMPDVSKCVSVLVDKLEKTLAEKTEEVERWVGSGLMCLNKLFKHCIVSEYELKERTLSICNKLLSIELTLTESTQHKDEIESILQLVELIGVDYKLMKKAVQDGFMLNVLRMKKWVRFGGYVDVLSLLCHKALDDEETLAVNMASVLVLVYRELEQKNSTVLFDDLLIACGSAIKRDKSLFIRVCKTVVVLRQGDNGVIVKLNKQYIRKFNFCLGRFKSALSLKGDVSTRSALLSCLLDRLSLLCVDGDVLKDSCYSLIELVGVLKTILKLYPFMSVLLFKYKLNKSTSEWVNKQLSNDAIQQNWLKLFVCGILCGEAGSDVRLVKECSKLLSSAASKCPRQQANQIIDALCSMLCTVVSSTEQTPLVIRSIANLTNALRYQLMSRSGNAGKSVNTAVARRLHSKEIGHVLINGLNRLDLTHPRVCSTINGVLKPLEFMTRPNVLSALDELVESKDVEVDKDVDMVIGESVSDEEEEEEEEEDGNDDDDTEVNDEVVDEDEDDVVDDDEDDEAELEEDEEEEEEEEDDDDDDDDNGFPFNNWIPLEQDQITSVPITESLSNIFGIDIDASNGSVTRLENTISPDNTFDTFDPSRIMSLRVPVNFRLPRDAQGLDDEIHSMLRRMVEPQSLEMLANHLQVRGQGSSLFPRELSSRLTNLPGFSDRFSSRRERPRVLTSSVPGHLGGNRARTHRLLSSTASRTTPDRTTFSLRRRNRALGRMHGSRRNENGRTVRHVHLARWSDELGGADADVVGEVVGQVGISEEPVESETTTEDLAQALESNMQVTPPESMETEATVQEPVDDTDMAEEVHNETVEETVEEQVTPEVNSTEVNATEVNSTEVNSTEVNSTEVNSTEVSTGEGAAAVSDLPPVPPGVDADVWASLPDFMRQEILDGLPQELRNPTTSTQESNTPPADPANAQDMDTASFIASITDPALRREILSSVDDAVLATLPTHLRAETEVLRQRAMASRPTYRQRMSRMTSTAETEEQEARRMRPVIVLREDYDKDNKVVLNIQEKDIQYLIKLLFILRPIKKTLRVVLLNLTHVERHRDMIVKTIINALKLHHEGYDRSWIPSAMIGCTDPAFAINSSQVLSNATTVSPLAAKRLLETLKFLCAHSARVLMLCLGEYLEFLLGLLSVDEVRLSSVHVSLVIQVLYTAVDPLRLLPEKGKEKEIEYADGEVAVPVRVVDKRYLGPLADIITMESCSNDTFTKATTVLSNLSKVPENRISLLEELSRTAEALGQQAVVDLKECTDSSSTSEVKLLRVLKTLRSLAKDSDELCSICSGLQLKQLWELLFNCLQSGEDMSVAKPSEAELEDVGVSATTLGFAHARLPVIKAFFILTGDSKNESDEKTVVDFVQRYKSVLNALVNQNPSLLDDSFSCLVKNTRCRASLDFENKRLYFKSALKKLRQGHRYGTIRLSVRRNFVFEDSFITLSLRTKEEMRGRLSIQFHGEEGIDAGGVTREWYAILAKTMFKPGYALFKPSADSSAFQPDPRSHYVPEHLKYFKFVGRVVGKAIADGHLLDAHFTRSFHKHILALPISHSDLQSLDPQYYKSLCDLLTLNIADIGLDLTFTADSDEFGLLKTVELKPGGADIKVTEENKMEYIKLAAKHRMTTGIQKQIDAFLEGFHELVPKELISIFDESELELLICGIPEVDLGDLKANTEYRGYTISSPQVRWFWNALEKMTPADHAKFLMFVTGTSKVPLEGFKALVGMRGFQKFSIHKAYGSDRNLPSAHTCFNQLDLPEYSTEELLVEKLSYAIRNCEGFGFG